METGTTETGLEWRLSGVVTVRRTLTSKDKYATFDKRFVSVGLIKTVTENNSVCHGNR